MNEPIEIIPFTGFDPEGEPEIRVMADGSWELVFNFMPPSWVERRGRYSVKQTSSTVKRRGTIG
jgi:hypothetical protein